MKYQRRISLLLALCILLSVLPVAAAASSMTVSDALVEFIKGCEGFTKYATWDYQHYSIGYGTQCEPGDYPNGITEEEAEVLLRKAIGSAEEAVNRFADRHSLELSQQQYDCLATITYGLGTEWMLSKYDLPKLFIEGCTELELLNVLGSWVTANGQTLNGLIYRRMRETYIYFHGQYNISDNIAKDTPYACVKFDPAGGNVSLKRQYTFREQAYGLYKSLPIPTKNGYIFGGWYDENGNQITDSSIAKTSLVTVTARWNEGEHFYSDVNASDWFYEDVKKAEKLGLFEGFPDGSFRPNVSITRAMFAQVLYRVAGAPESEGELPFTDVPENAWYRQAVGWAYSNGIVNGVSEALFAPDRKITREQMATMLFKYCSTLEKAYPAQYGSLEDFADKDNISGYALEPLCWAVGTGLIQGMNDGTLAPKKEATRAQAAAILVRLQKELEKGVA